MKKRHILLSIPFIGILLYLAGALIVFDFSVTARPYDEEIHNGKEVAIGPRPRWWVPGAAFDYDFPGGFGYDTSGWCFVFWKPLCLAYVDHHGFERPMKWRKE